MNKAVISKDAFIVMVSAAAEVYEKETYGMLFGRKYKKNFLVDYAYPHQSSIRDKEGLYISVRSEQRLLNTLNFFNGYRYIGEFHSHSEGACSFSKHDIIDLKEGGAGVSFLVSIEKTIKYKKWEYVPKDKRIQGTINKKFLVMIKAYYCDKPGARVRKLKLECDFLKILNKRVKKNNPEWFKIKKAIRK